MLQLSSSAYRILTSADVAAYLDGLDSATDVLGGTPEQWRVRDVADGNLNSVFLVDGPNGGLCVKQALPYARIHGEAWPLDINRALFEVSYAQRLEPHVGKLIPKIYHYDPVQYVIVMEQLTPHIILRKALIAGAHYPKVPTDVAEFLANAAFYTSDLAAPFEVKAADLEIFSRNQSLQRISVDLIFTDPYLTVWRNKIVEPLAAWGAALRTDIDLKITVARARLDYLSKAQSLIHGDLHSGSIMVTEGETRVIDGEFAWVGPTGFDVGNFIAHYVMAWYAKPFQREGGDAGSFRAKIVADIVLFWETFERRFLEIWRAADGDNDGVPKGHFDDPTARARLETFRRDYVAGIFADAKRYLALKVIRRIIGYAQIADFLVIADEVARGQAQAGALALARSLLIHPDRYGDIAAIVASLPRFENVGLNPETSRHL